MARKGVAKTEAHRQKIKAARLAQEAAKPREEREAQNRRIGDGVRAAKAAKKGQTK